MQSVKCVPTRTVCTHFEDINKYIIVRTLVNVSDTRVHIIVIIIICIYPNDIGEGLTGRLDGNSTKTARLYPSPNPTFSSR